MVEKLHVRYPDFARRLQDRAEPLGVGIRDIKGRLDVTYEMARRYWQGIARPRGKRMALLAAMLEMTPAELDYGGPAKAEERRATYGLSQSAIQIGLAWMKLSPHMQQLYRETMFRDAAVESVLPWLKPTLNRPTSPNYDSFEKSIEHDYQQHINQLKLDL